MATGHADSATFNGNISSSEEHSFHSSTSLTQVLAHQITAYCMSLGEWVNVSKVAHDYHHTYHL